MDTVSRTSSLTLALAGILLAGLFAVSCTQPSPAAAPATQKVNADSIKQVAADSLRQSIRDSVNHWLQDSIHSKAVNDSVFDKLYDSVFKVAYRDLSAKQDSALQARDSVLRDSLRTSLYDSLYAQVYADLYSQRAIDWIHPLLVRYSAMVYPAYLAYASVLEADSLLQGLAGFRIYNSNTTTPYQVIVEVELTGYSNTGRVMKPLNPGDTASFVVQPTFNYPTLIAVSDGTPGEIRYRIAVMKNDQAVVLYEENLPVSIASHQTFAWTMVRGTDSTDYSIAAPVWVTPSSDSVTALLHDAALLHPNKALLGYQIFPGMDTSESIRSQVEAIYNALQARQILYVNNPVSLTSGQKIKYPSDVMRTHSANCIERAFLFASALEALGIEPLIVSTVDHAFVGWYTWSGSGSADFLETTMTWDIPQAPFTAALNEGISEYQTEVDSLHFEHGTSHMLDIQGLRDQYHFASFPGK